MKPTDETFDWAVRQGFTHGFDHIQNAPTAAARKHDEPSSSSRRSPGCPRNEQLRASNSRRYLFATTAPDRTRSCMAAVATLRTRDALPDPAEGKAAGAFEDATLQALYDRLIEEGSASQTAAIQAGIEIEELDIRDITEASADVTHADIQRAYDQLTRGSRNHLQSLFAGSSAW
jgi:hypothetical protein